MQAFSALPFNISSFRPDYWIEAGDAPGAHGTVLSSIANKGFASVTTSQSTANLQSKLYRGDARNGRSFFFISDDTGANQGYTTNLTLGSQWAMFAAERPYLNLGSTRTIQGSNPTNSVFSLGRADNISAYLGGTVSTNYIRLNEVGVGCFKTGASGNLEMWIQGLNRTTASVANTSFGTINIGAVGMFNEAGYTRLYEVIIFNRFVTDAERAAIMAHLISKYGASPTSILTP